MYMPLKLIQIITAFKVVYTLLYTKLKVNFYSEHKYHFNHVNIAYTLSHTNQMFIQCTLYCCTEKQGLLSKGR